MNRLTAIAIALLPFVVVSLPGPAAAQPKQGKARLDSLLAELPMMKEDTAGVKLLNNIAFDYSHIDPGKGILYAGRERALAEKTGWRKGEAEAYNDLGNNYQSKGELAASLEAFFKALGICEELGYNEGIGAVSTNIGNTYLRIGNYPKALEYHTKALNLAKARNDKKRIQTASGNIGNVYDDLGNYAEALKYKKESLAAAEALNDQRSVIVQTGNIGATYTLLRQYPAALAYEFKALRLAQRTGDKESIAINTGNIGETYCLIAGDSLAVMPDSLVPAGKAARLAAAVAYTSKGIAVSREIYYQEGIAEFSRYLAKAYELQGNYKGALAACQQYNSLKDSLYSIENNSKISGLETKRALELKDKDIVIAKLAVAKKRNERAFFIAGIVVLLGVMSMLFRSYKRQQHSNVLLTKEKKRSDDLLRNILPAEVAEELKERGVSAAKQYEEVSVLFTDFVDFTGTANQLSPQALVQELHECFSAFDAIAERNGLEKIKTIGDAYMAVCGLPAADPDHAKKTVQAAIGIRDFIEARRKNERVFEIRIGINSGPVVAGIVGVKKFAYDIWGDTVNMAARMEQHGEAGRINISQSTYELIRQDFACKARGRIIAKNKGEVEMYFVEAAVAQPA